MVLHTPRWRYIELTRRNRIRVLASAAAASVGLSSAAFATITATWQTVPISAQAIASDPLLASMQSWDLIVNVNDIGDWGSAGLRVDLASGLFYQPQTFNGNTRPTQSVINANPNVAYDTYVTGPEDNGTTGQPVILGGHPADPASFGGANDPLPGTFSVSWGDLFTSAPGTYQIARLTFPQGIQTLTLEGSFVSQTEPFEAADIPAIPFVPATARAWILDGDGSWHVPSNWSPAAVPIDGDAVVLDVGGANVRTITYSQGSVSLQSIMSQERLVITGGSINTPSLFSANGVTMSGGTLNATVSGSPVSIVGTNVGLNDVRALSGISIAGGASALVTNDLELSNASTLAGSATLQFRGSQELLGAGSIAMGNGASIWIDGDGTLTIPNSGAVISGSTYNVRRTPLTPGPASLVVNGSLIANGTGNLALVLDGLGNTGSLIADNSGALNATVSSPMYSTGNIIARNGGVVTLNAPGGITISGGVNADTSSPVRINSTVNLTSTLTKSGAGPMRVTGALNVGASTFTITGGSVLFDYSGSSPLANIRSLIASGYAGGAWNGSGINMGGAIEDHGLGYAEASALFGAFPASFDGESIDNTTLVIRFTRVGDTDLNGVVNLLDFNRLADNFNKTNKLWSDGDFNYDGNVNLTDFNMVADNFNLPAVTGAPTPQDWNNLAAAVPEPASAALVSLPLSLVMTRRRRSRYSP